MDEAGTSLGIPAADAVPNADGQSEPWWQLPAYLDKLWRSSGLDRFHLPAWLKPGWPLPSTQAYCQQASTRINAQLQQVLQQAPLPQVSCTRRSALRFQVDHFDWELLTALQASSRPAALELVLEDEQPCSSPDDQLW